MKNQTFNEYVDKLVKYILGKAPYPHNPKELNSDEIMEAGRKACRMTRDTNDNQ